MSTRLVGFGGLLALTLLGATGGCGGGGGGGAPPAAVAVVPQKIPLGTQVTRVAAADVNGDGAMDLLVHESDISSVELLLADRGPRTAGKAVILGSAEYRSAGHVFVWDSTADLCVADMDGDGCPDLVVAGGDANAIGIWRCDPLDRTHFLDPFILDVGMPVTRVAVGDVNGDGLQDLVCLDEATGRVRFSLHMASAFAFTVDSSPPTLGACFGLVLCDLDRDGKLDLVTNRGSGTITTYVCDGAVHAPRDIATGMATGRAFAVGDVDGDGWLDVCVLGTGGKSIACVRQSSPGVFDVSTSPLGISVDEQGVHVTCPVAQWGIGRGIGSPMGGTKDRLSSAPSISGQLVSGIAIDQPGMHYDEGLCLAQPGLCLGDFDGDGKLDVCARAADAAGGMVFCFGHGTGGSFRFDVVERHSQGGTTGPPLALADLDGDGQLDLCAGGGTLNPLFVQSRKVWGLAGGSHTFTVQARVSDCVIADVDRDGFPDLVCATNAGVEIEWGDASASFSTHSIVGPAAPWTRVAVGDVNGDGRPDIVVCGDVVAAVIPADPAGARKYKVAIPIGGLGAVPLMAFSIGDFDGDSHCDFCCVRQGSPTASFSHGNGDGTFTGSPVSFDTGIASPAGCVACDLDGDGKLDFCVVGAQGVSTVKQESGVGPVKWLPPEVIQGFTGGVFIAAGDLDGDGRCDLCADGTNGCVCVVHDPAEPSRMINGYALSSDACAGLVTGDLNGDGLVDVGFVETTTGQIRCRNGNPNDTGPFSLRLNGLPPGEPVIGTLTLHGDLDGDGVPDVLTVTTELGATTSTFKEFKGHVTLIK